MSNFKDIYDSVSNIEGLENTTILKTLKAFEKKINAFCFIYKTSAELTSQSTSVELSSTNITNLSPFIVDKFMFSNNGLLFKIKGYTATLVFIEYYTTLFNSLTETLESAEFTQNDVAVDDTNIVISGNLKVTTTSGSVTVPLSLTYNTTAGDGLIIDASEDNSSLVFKLDPNAISNPNLLINGDFRVNQRGIYSNNVANLYMADRWYKVYGPACQVDISEPYAKLTILASGSGVTTMFRQRIECPKSLIGKTITGSCFIKDLSTSNDNSIYCCLRALNSSNKQIAFANITTISGAINSGSMTIPENTVYIDFAINTNRDILQIGDYIEFGYCKIEIGSIATAYSPRPYAEELAMCQRYYQKISSISSNASIGYAAINANQNNVIAFFNFNNMRTLPTFSYSGNFQVQVYGKPLINITEMSLDQCSSNIVRANATISTTFDIGTFGNIRANNDTDAYISLDAEIY